MRIILLSLLLWTATVNAQDLNAIRDLLQAHQYEQVIKQLENQELNTAYQLALIEAYRQSGQSAKAIKMLNDVWQADTTNAKVALSLGETYYGRSQYKEAYFYFATLTTLDTTNAYYHKLAGKSADKMANLKANALYHFSEALRLAPNDRNAAYFLAIAILDFQEVKAARSLTQRFVAQDSSDIGMLILDTRLAYLDDQFDSVMANIEYLLQRGDTVASVLRLYGASLYQTYQFEEARFWLKKALQVAPSEQVYFYLGMTFFKQEQFDSATVYIQKAIDETMSPNLGEFYTNLALALDNDGKKWPAMAVYNKAYDLTENPMLLYRMAIVNEDLGRIELARKQYMQFLEQTPERTTNQRMYAEDRLKDLKVADFMDTSDED